MAKMNWDKVNKQNAEHRNVINLANAIHITGRIPTNTFHGVDGGPEERLKLLRIERTKRAQAHERARKQWELEQKELDSKRQYNEAIVLANKERLRRRNRIDVNKVAYKAPAKRTVTTTNGTHSSVSTTKRNKTINLQKKSLLLSLSRSLTEAIERADMASVASLASKIYGESF
ncbi:MAG: hypothetical protein JST61_13815 [Acidobacteria bacterium]|nr:hypothetical protein [Acidobacteriota bacterium]